MVLAWSDITVEAVTPPGATPTKVAPATATARLWAITWQELVPLGILLLLIALAIYRRRRRRTSRGRRGGPSDAPDDGGSHRALADRRA